ncbi:hypothetical protein [Allokutzneria sp. NRRL B-24872]|uniref:hypothetical protein n=1 Tax=Allokutzneria sp. NRRL B-24872 TaxID=1137961 RepID=UPI000A38C374|nr:hypothetical protein [Allokutzneria sp. NRRL B-24872]
MPGPIAFPVDSFTIVLLTEGENAATLPPAEVEQLETEHIRAMLRSKAEGRLHAIGAVQGNIETTPGKPLLSIGFWNATPDELRAIMAEDSAVASGVYSAQIARFVCSQGSVRFE